MSISGCRVLWVVGLVIAIAPAAPAGAAEDPPGETRLPSSVFRLQPPPPVETRAVWVDRRNIPNTERGVRDLIRRYARAGINVVHPEVIYNGYSAYPSAYLTQQDLWGGLDVLRIIIDESRRHGIEVHAWVWAFRAGHEGDKGGILTKRPEWAAVSREGQVMTEGKGYWLCPSIPAVRRLLLNAMRELVEKYPVDGIELDYIRFDSINYCYNESCRTRFQAEHNVDPLAIEPFTPPVLEWRLWRENLVNTFVAQLAAEMRQVRPRLKVSAAVASLPDQARLNHLQNWAHWAANRWVDFLAPMDYTPDPARFRSLVSRSQEAIADRTLLAPGIGLHLFKEASPPLAQVEIAREIPVSGVTLFATAYLDADRVESLGAGPFRRRAAIPFRAPLEGAAQLLASARDRIRGVPAPEALLAAEREVAAAGSLLRYTAYRTEPVQAVAPTRPPIFIPDEVLPLPEAQAARVPAAPAIDGRLDDAVWQKAARISLEFTPLGDRAPQPTEVYLAYDAQNLYIAYRNHQPGAPRAQVTQRDGAVFLDDSVEVYLDAAGELRDYYHLAVNALGTQYDARGRDAKLTAQWEAAVGREARAWTVELAIPLAQLGVAELPAGAAWRANFHRNRVVERNGRELQHMSWSPTYGSYHTPIRFGRLSLSP